MVKILPWITLCSKCNVRLEYNNEDIQSEDHEYSLDGKKINKETLHYIVCPKCGNKIYTD